MKQVDWTPQRYATFCELTYMTDYQRQVMDLHVIKDMDDLNIALATDSSVSTVQRAIRDCKDMYDIVQPYSRFLEKRRLTKKELNKR